nr:hypothetical protein [Tanacetum cinerariifolium]
MTVTIVSLRGPEVSRLKDICKENVRMKVAEDPVMDEKIGTLLSYHLQWRRSGQSSLGRAEADKVRAQVDRVWN